MKFMEIPYHYSYSCTPNMNSRKINTTIKFIHSVFLKHLYPTLMLPSHSYIDIHIRLIWTTVRSFISLPVTLVDSLKRNLKILYIGTWLVSWEYDAHPTLIGLGNWDLFLGCYISFAVKSFMYSSYHTLQAWKPKPLTVISQYILHMVGTKEEQKGGNWSHFKMQSKAEQSRREETTKINQKKRGLKRNENY